MKWLLWQSQPDGLSKGQKYTSKKISSDFTKWIGHLAILCCPQLTWKIICPFLFSLASVSGQHKFSKAPLCSCWLCWPRSAGICLQRWLSALKLHRNEYLIQFRMNYCMEVSKCINFISSTGGDKQTEMARAGLRSRNPALSSPLWGLRTRVVLCVCLLGHARRMPGC